METTLAVLGLGALLFILLGFASAVLVATATLAGLLGAIGSLLDGRAAPVRRQTLR